MAVFTNRVKNTSTFTDRSKNTSTFTNEAKNTLSIATGYILTDSGDEVMVGENEDQSLIYREGETGFTNRTKN